MNGPKINGPKINGPKINGPEDGPKKWFKNSPKNSLKNSSRAQWSSRYFTPCPRTAPDQWNESEASHTFHFLDKFYFDYASLNLSCFVDSFRLRTTANPIAIRKDVLHYQETKFLLSIFPSHLCWEKSRYTRSVETKATISSWQSVRKSFRRISFLQLRLWQGG